MSLVGMIRVDEVELVEFGDGESQTLKVKLSLNCVNKSALTDFV